MNAPLKKVIPKTFASLECPGHYRDLDNVQDKKIPDILDHTNWGNFSNKIGYNLKLLDQYLDSVLVVKELQFGERYASNNCFSLLSLPRTEYEFAFQELLINNYLHFHLKLQEDRRMINISAATHTKFNLLLPVHSHVPKDYVTSDHENLTKLRQLVEKQLVKCDKSVYVGETEQINAKSLFLRRNYAGLKFEKGKDTMEFYPFGFTFIAQGPSVRKVPLLFRTIVETGVHRKLVQDEWSLMYCNVTGAVKLEQNETTESLLAGSLMTFFILWGTSIGIAITTLSYECRKIIYACATLCYRIILRACLNQVRQMFSVLSQIF